MLPSSSLQQVDGAAGVEAVGMRRDAAHRMHARPAGRPCARGGVRPSRSRAARPRPSSLEGGVRELGGDAPDGGGVDAGLAPRPPRARSADRDSARRGAGTTARRAGRRRASHSPLRSGCASAIVGGDDAPAARGRAPAACRARRARRGRDRPRRDRRSPATARWCSARDRRHRSRPARSSSWMSASTKSPSVPGRIAEPFVGDRGIAGAHRD